MEKRYCIQTKDVQLIMGRSDVWAENRLKTIKAALSKKKEQFVTIKEFCEYEGFDETEIKNFLGISI